MNLFVFQRKGANLSLTSAHRASSRLAWVASAKAAIRRSPRPAWSLPLTSSRTLEGRRGQLGDSQYPGSKKQFVRVEEGGRVKVVVVGGSGGGGEGGEGK